MKNIQITNEAKWALIGIGLMLVAFAILTATGVYKLDVISGGI